MKTWKNSTTKTDNNKYIGGEGEGRRILPLSFFFIKVFWRKEDDEMTVRLLQEKNTYTVDYPEAVEFAERQSNIFWLPDEIDVSKDLHDLKTNFTESEAHAVTTTLKLFTLYEMKAGDEYWGGRIMKRFPRPDIQRMANAFSFFELNVHAPFA